MTQPKTPRWPSILAFVLAAAGFSAFIYLDRKMAAPFPKKQTNSPAASATNSTKPAP